MADMTGHKGAVTRSWRKWLALAAIAALAVAAAVTAARLFGLEWGPLAYVIALTPWFALVAAMALVLAIVARSWWVVGAAVLVVAVHGWWLAPLFTSEAAHGEPALTVATVNASYGDADGAQIVALVTERDVDILSIQELTPDLVSELQAQGLDDLLPHAVVRAELDYRGIGLWSREPLEDMDVLDDLDSWALRARIGTGLGEHTVLAVHPVAPGVRGHATWSRDLAALIELTRATDGPMAVLGDFNTTRDHAAFRELERLGFRDECDDAGSGVQFTFPQGRGPLPFVAIDHVLMRDSPWRATSAQTVVIDGTDHRALVVTYSAK